MVEVTNYPRTNDLLPTSLEEAAREQKIRQDHVARVQADEVRSLVSQPVVPLAEVRAVRPVRKE